MATSAERAWSALAAADDLERRATELVESSLVAAATTSAA
jgi:hypothetical protein